MKPLISKNRNKLVVECPADLGTMHADQTKVRQTLFNLLSNAIKFTPDNGEVGIRATRSNAAVSISVWDTGVGIAEQDQQRIFEEFQQAEQELTDKTEGTGLGLALTKKLVNLHGGEIWVESEQDHGSTFTFTLPIEGDQESSIVA